MDSFCVCHSHSFYHYPRVMIGSISCMQDTLPKGNIVFLSSLLVFPKCMKWSERLGMSLQSDK